MAREVSHTPQKSKFGDRLVSFLEKRELSQTELAKMAGIERSTLNRLANNKREPRTEEVEWLAAALKISVDELVAGVEFDSEPPERDEREAELAARVLKAEAICNSATARVASLEKSLAETRAEIEKERAAARKKEAAMRKEAEEDVASLEEEYEQRERDMRATFSDKLDRLREKSLKREAQMRSDLWNLRQDLFTKEMTISDAETQIAILQKRNAALEKAISGAKAATVIGALFGTAFGAALGSASGKSSYDEDYDDDEY
ncbi:helix-turn-helix domain-containing protein [Haliangium ochraceum]|uniref:Transcriptional regulator, XRE family n=1 Tax=Haliangium ochraceum (strain DSM 14365 / JCM 11303 / SMP-2) TaxID=502025 RepID=D0LVS5_HALO1|nr:helix-turn-helix transcriptional regulator [Haliangium ochraceum]ACY14059.1 transcriptional regulator, XRE family [Haliangium ochraceum DSM 14365]